RRRVVLAVDVLEREVSWHAYDDEPSAVIVSATIPMSAVVSGHVDVPEASEDVAAAADAIGASDAGDEDAAFTVDSAEGRELAWYATQELQYIPNDRG